MGASYAGDQNLGFDNATTMLGAKVDTLQATTQNLYQNSDSSGKYLDYFTLTAIEYVNEGT